MLPQDDERMQKPRRGRRLRDPHQAALEIHEPDGSEETIEAAAIKLAG